MRAREVSKSGKAAFHPCRYRVERRAARAPTAIPDGRANQGFRDCLCSTSTKCDSRPMNRKITASCLCGSVGISCGVPTGPAAYCHCEDCRKCTGSAFNISVPFQAETFRVTSGEIGSFAKTADSGNELTRHFCRNCGSPLYTSSLRHPDVVYVKAGILDDPSSVQPVYQSWCQSRVGWATIPPGLRSYERDRR